MNLLRLIFATCVLIGHSFVALSVKNTIPNPIKYIILFLPVPCFFYVSGYLITASAIKNDLKTFFKKRFARIYPAYLASIILTVSIFAPLAFMIINNGNFDLNTYLSQTPSPLRFLIFNIPLKLFEYQIGTILKTINMTTWNASAWTLIFEFGCYIGIALTLLLLTKLKIKKTNFSKIIFGLYMTLILLSIILPKSESGTVLDFINTAIYLSCLFLGGSYMYLIKDKLKFSFRILIPALLFCIFTMILLTPSIALEISAIPMTYLILFISVTLKSPKFIQKNDISYGVYIYAWPIQCVISCFITVHGISANIWEYTIICWVITAILAFISWFVLEKPILNKVR